MNRKKRCPSRKRQAIFWCAVVLMLLVLLRLTTGEYALLPIQTLWELEEGHGCGRTEVLRRSVDLNEGRVKYLAANENILVFVAVEPTWWGWEIMDRSVVNWPEEAPLCGTGERRRAIGRVQEASIVQVEHAFWFAPLDEEHNEGQPKLYTYTTEPDDWYEWEGKRYFLMEYEPLGYGYYRSGRLIGYDAAGRVVAESIMR